ncbi:uncharacterized protein LOC112344341 isoform X2 [Selaginella moellendorffii]|uniref:uncharacterized protein LOC112344341 isoform X2 n=1 Tax=Selaginella moellendorffii TaxID=88036 RepID=UPI000D1C56A4|nr:uncharacterized protein LOC112344341 isoform X2 [Selaginella moellendorffii]|eukprot:XP_024524618.1 uncharacterized protein LOC112344341 isoform X2 [Selaginella moellendorffii]
MVVLAPGIHTSSGKRESLALAVVDGLYRWREIVGPCGNSRLLGGRICGTKRELSLSAERSRMRTLVWDGMRPGSFSLSLHILFGLVAMVSFSMRQNKRARCALYNRREKGQQRSSRVMKGGLNGMKRRNA